MVSARSCKGRLRSVCKNYHAFLRLFSTLCHEISYSSLVLLFPAKYLSLTMLQLCSQTKVPPSLADNISIDYLRKSN